MRLKKSYTTFIMEFKSYISSVLDLDGLSSDEVASLLQDVADPRMGDVALPCFKLAARLKKPPQAIAAQIAEKFTSDGLVERAQAVNGYVNFFFDRKAASRRILAELPDMNGELLKNVGQGRTICIDYSSINIAKPFHIGHLGTTAIGGSLCKIFKALGYSAVGINHLGDWGTQFGKLIVAFKKWSDRETIEKGGVRALQEIYVRFHREEETDPSLTDKAREWFAKLEKGDEEATELFSFFKKITLDEVEKVYKRLNVSFDSYNGESFYNDKMQPIVDTLREKGLLKEDQGAQIVDLEPYGMPPALILRSDGATLYITRDLAAAKYRMDTYHFDKSLYVVAYQQDLHFRQLFKVLQLMGYDWYKDCEHVAFGMVSFEGQTLSTREGRIVYLEDLLNTSIEKARAIIDEKSPDLENKDEVARQVGVGAVVFFALYNNRIKDIDFWWDRALNFDGETGPYVMYTHARACSVLRKAGECDAQPDFSALSDPEAQDVVRLIGQFPEVAKNALNRSEPSMITRFSVDLAQAYNKFYYERKVMVDEPGVRAARIQLTRATRDLLRLSLNLIGITAPTRM